MFSISVADVQRFRESMLTANLAPKSRGEQAGFYVGHLDGHPAGYIKNNRTGVEMRWRSQGYVLDREQQATMQAAAVEKLQARAAEQERRHEQVAERVGQQLQDLVSFRSARRRPK